MTKPKWRDIPGWVGTYQVSNDGKVRSIPRIARCGNAGFRHKTGQMLQPFKNKHGGCGRVCLYRPGQRRKLRVADLVQLAFPELQPITMPTTHRQMPGGRNSMRMLWSVQPSSNACAGSHMQ